MEFSYKLAELRRKKGWTQEELAEKMDVTRQSVSKWEGGLSIPDLEKIIKLSELFDVSTDYLIKSNSSQQEVVSNKIEVDTRRLVNMTEAIQYIEAKSTSAKIIAFATFLCILSPLALINLSVLGEPNRFHFTENMAIGGGLIVMFLLVAIAVSFFVYSSFKTKEFSFIEKTPFRLDYGTKETIKEKKRSNNAKLERNRIIGIFLCIVSLIPLFLATMINDTDDVLIVGGLSLSACIAGVGVMIIIITSMKLTSYETLMTEARNIRKEEEEDSIAGPYWSVLVAIFLGYSFITNDWKHSWVIFVVGALFMPLLFVIVKSVKKKNG